MCLKGKKIGSKIYVFRQVAMREKFNFFPAFFVKCSISNGYDPAQLPQMLQETKQQIREKSCDLMNSFSVACRKFSFLFLF